MKQEQALHIGMLNSFNVITGKATYDDILNAGIGFFAHDPNEMDPDSLKILIRYFQELEMFEYCKELKDVYDEYYNEDGSIRDPLCECDFPVINGYTKKVMCGDCGKRILR